MNAPALPRIRLAVLLGSTSSSKVFSALQFHGIPYETELLSAFALRRALPPPHLVPVATIGDEVVADSTAILRRVDELADGRFGFYPEGRDDIRQFSDWVQARLFPLLFYFSLWNDEGWKRSTLPFVRRDMPWWTWLVPPSILRKGAMDKRRRAVELQFTPEDLASPARMRRAGLADMARVERLFEASPTPWLFGTPKPTGADFALFGELQALVGRSGDSDIEPATPFILDAAPRVRAFYDKLDAMSDMRFRG